MNKFCNIFCSFIINYYVSHAFEIENAFVISNNSSNSIIATGNLFDLSIGYKLSSAKFAKDNLEMSKLGKLHFSEVYRSPISGKIVNLVTIPIIDNSGKTIAILGFTIPTSDHVEKFLRTIKIGSTGSSFILDKHNVVIYSNNEKYNLFDWSIVSVSSRAVQ